MSSLINQATIKGRRDTSAAWTANNPTLADGEWGHETDSQKSKRGDGSTAWNSLGYAVDPTAIDSKITGSTDQIAKSWGNFNGTGTVAIRAGYNFASLIDSGTGIYDVVFTNNMSNANYAVITTRGRADGNGTTTVESGSQTVSGFTIRTSTSSNGSPEDADYVFFAVFGD